MLRTGILMPRSTLFPSLRLDILNGLKENLKKQGLYEKIKLFTDNIGFGVNEQEIYTKAEKMLLQDDVDIAIVCADTRIAEMLQPLFTSSNKILLMVNFGVNFPDNWQPAPTTITHSLNFCMHAGLTAKLAALETNKKAINVVSYYDGGYRQCFSMLNSHQANGGIPVFNHITNIKLEAFTLQPVEAFLEGNADVNTLLCLFAGDQAERFYPEVSPLQKKFNLSLYVSPMMFDASLKDSLPSDFSIEKVKGYVPWHPTLENSGNKLFKETYSVATGNSVNYFSLLGWETGLIVSEIIRQKNSGNTNAKAVVKLLTEKMFDSPRGWMKIDPATQQSYGPAYLAICNKNFEITIKEEINNIEQEWKEFTGSKLHPGESSSWRNTYLCI